MTQNIMRKKVTTGGIDGDDDVMIIGTRNCVDQKIQVKIQEDLQD